MTPGNGPKVAITTTIDSQGSVKQIHDAVQAVARSVTLTGGAFASYEKRLGKIIKDLDTITRQGSNAGQTVRDLALAGGGSVAGRVRQSNANATKAAMSQTQEVLVADIVNFQAGVYKSVARSVKSALVTSMAKSKQELASLDKEIRDAQIAAQRARVGFATQLSGTRGNVRGTITENANSLGVQNLGTLKAEQAALDKLLTAEQAYKAQAALVNTELRQQEQLMGSISRLSNQRLAPLRAQLEAAQKQNAIERQNLEIYKAQQRGDQGGVLKARLKQESLRLDQMALQGIKQESVEFQKQMELIKNLNLEQQRLNDTRRQGTKELRDQARLQESRNFAAGKGANQEVMQNNIIGARRVSSSTESRASLLGMQGNLLMNYGLLGGGVAAIGAMTAGVIDLDAKLRELQAIAGATNGEFEGLRSAVLKASEDTKFSAVELAEASVLLAQVGQSVREIEDTLPVISKFAMAVGTDMKNAVDIVTTSLTVFNMGSQQTQRITDVLTEALNRSKLSMDQLVLGFQYAANIAADSGVTFEELTATLAGMSQAGIRSGSMLGTGLRQILISLSAPTEEVSALISQLGLSMADVDVRSQGLTGVLENLSNAGLTAADAMGAFETRTAAALVAASNQVNFIRETQEGFTMTTAAQTAAAVQSESFKNSFLELKNEAMSFLNDAARPVLQGLITMAKTMKEVGNSIGPMVPLLKAAASALIIFAGATAVLGVVKLGAAFVTFSGVLTPLMTVIPTLTRAWNMLTLSMTASGIAGSRLGLAFAAIQTAFPPLLLLAGVAAGLTAIYMATKNGANAADEFTKQLDAQKTAFNESKAAQEKYQQTLSQIDQTIARVRSRADNLKDGSQALRIEIMNGAATFNEYGAGIDATNVKLQDYIVTLTNAKNAVMALAGEQAKQAAKEADQMTRTAQSGFASSFNALADRAGFDSNATAANSNQNNTRARLLREAGASNKLTPQEMGNLTYMFDTIQKLAQKNVTELTDGEINNFLTNSQGLINLLGKANVGTSQVAALNSARFDASTYMSARANSRNTAVTAGGLALLNDPNWRQFRDNLVKNIMEPMAGLGPAMSESARANRGNPAAGFASGERILAQYGAIYRKAQSDYDKLRTDFDYENKTPEEQYAFDQSLLPVNDELVRIREILISTQRANDQLAAENLQVLLPLVEASPTSAFPELLRQAGTMGLTPGRDVIDKASFIDWITLEISRRTNGVALDNLLGRDAGMSVIRQGVREETIRNTGAVAQRERIPMAQRIRDAAEAAGLSPDLMRGIASMETGGRFNADATNPKSTARGLFQFMYDTWNEMRPTMRVSDRIDDRNPNDPRLNPDLNIEAAMEYAKVIERQMTRLIDRRPTDPEMYLGWNQGAGGASRIINNPNDNAIQSAVNSGTYSSVTRARNSILQNGGNESMTNAEFASMMRGKFAQHMLNGAGGNDSMRTLGETIEANAEEARKNMEAIADGAKTVATTSKALATRTLRNVGSNTSDTAADEAVTAITVALKDVEDQTKRYYDLRLQALRTYRDTMEQAGRLTPDQLLGLNTQIDDMMNAQENEMDRVQEETIKTFTDLYSKLPQAAGSIGDSIESITNALAGIQDAFENSAEQINIRFQEARERIASDVDAREVAFGRMSSAEAAARAAMRGRAANNAAERGQPGVLASSVSRAAIATNGLNGQLGDTGISLRDVTNARLIQERAKLLTMSREDEQSYGRQNALVEQMTEHIGAINDLRITERDLLIEIEAITEAMANNGLNFSERASVIVQGWAEEQGVFKSMVTDVLDSIPGLLDTTQGAFATFFSDIVSGTATVGGAFKAMAQTILKAMLDVVASEAAKQMMRLVLNLVNSFIGGGSPMGGSGPLPISGGSSSGWFGLNGGGGGTAFNFKEGGYINAKGGYGPVRGRDSVKINAMPGEYVLRKSAVDAIGVDNLNQINAQGNTVSSGALAAQPVIMPSMGKPERPLEVYVVSPDQTPPPTKDQIIVMVQEDMINRGPVYKTTKAIQNGAI